MRLVGGQEPNSGRVEVRRANKWGWFCDEGFYSSKVSIICNQLGYKSGDMYSIDVNETNPFMWRTNLHCHGSEPFIDACDNQHWSYENFYSSWCQSNPPTVFCYGDVKLHTGLYNKTGVLKVYMDENYYSLCADDFSIQNAEVVCRQLGFSTNAVRILPSSSFQQQGMTSGMKYSCSGTESNLADCPSSNDTCSSDRNQVVLSCSDGASQGSDGDIQIDSNGYVTILYYGIWGKICGLAWDNNAAKVACKQMGYETGMAHKKYIHQSDKPLWVDTVDCNGSEKAIKDCQITTELNSTCSNAAAAYAYCYNSSTEPTYSIIGSNVTSSNSGYVETVREGERGYVCESDGYHNYEADTVCRSLGYVEGEKYPMGQLPFTAAFWKNSFFCSNKEPLLHLCATSQWSYLTHTNDSYDREWCRRFPLSVFCYNKVRLHSMYRNSSGLVLQNKDNRKYRYCADNVDLNTASILCRQIGFDHARVILPGYAYDHLDYYTMGYHNLSCPSGAVKLDECTVDFDVNGTCDSGALALGCNGGNSMPDGVTRILKDGTVEVSKHGVWGTISSLNWDDVDAKVVCKENGFESGVSLVRFSRERPRWMYDVNCTGTESKLVSCSYENIGYTETGIYTANAAVFCYAPSEVGTYELENGNYGRLLLTREGKTGYVCDPDYVARSDLITACKTLGYESGDVYPSPALPYGHLFWMADFSCESDSPILESCMKSGWTNKTDAWSCRDHNTFSVYCYGRVRLHVAYRNNTGILLITNKQEKYSICSEGFDMVSANVSCKEMGFVGVRRILPSYIFTNYHTTKYSNFQCNGNEASLMDCPHEEHGCNGSFVVVECDDSGLPPFSNYTAATPNYNNYNYTPPYNNWNNTNGYTPSYNNSDSTTDNNYVSDRNSSNSNSSVPPGGMTSGNNTDGGVTGSSNSNGNNTESGVTNPPSTTGNNAVVTDPTGSSGSNTTINSDGDTANPNSPKPAVPTKTSGNSGDTGSNPSNPSDSNDDSNAGKKSSAAFISIVRSCILLTIVVAIIGHF
ncbi:hypothetical protein LOTGIDRAFT_235293 [Lottia gigantea]|uniref:SRCR domain-containing protein n=1 Tax=Lottia gigantea TaxID=225164 RepID=V4BDJ1_LOTGI|nr:hypothetical protein LOTGIDRAFT_235293 [Lottia gigantea]ESO86689.1 hypothetical protein LOTGIDRAFT_235293 [Lottia gigantea]